ncbi:hypothetical protein F4801DRAFT_127059 [Xylaria longipes]|nr:hypothetical protein F4801DRAFT_127059 [Xylaria longipes]
MPISRKKACEQCRVAKARCSLESVCSRCLNRGLTCEYNGGPSRLGPYNRPHLLEPEQRLSLGSPAVASEPLSSLFRPPHLGFPYLESENFLREDPALDNIQLAGWGPYQINEPQGISLDRATWNRREAAVPPTLAVDSLLQEPRGSPTVNGPPASVLPWDFIGTSQLAGSQPIGHSAAIPENSAESVATAKSLTQPDCPSSPVDESGTSSNMGDDMIIVIKERRCELSETQRQAVTTERRLMARILSSQVENYPRMLIQGSRLPPFIYPQCVLNNRLCHQCIAVTGTHQCLPEPLANCAALVRMFYSRSSKNAHFVWKTIYDEQKRLYEQSHNFDVPTLLAAVQAVVIYVLMQAQDTESMAKNEVASLAATLSEMATSLHFQTKYQSGILHNPNLSQHSWVIHESIRRTFNLFYVIGILLIIRIGNPKQSNCTSIRETPLPCGRELWEPEATETFAIRLHRYKSRMVSTNRGLVIGDLYDALDPGQSGQNDAPDSLVQKGLVTWCENLDELGTLVWMASLLDRQAR